MGEAGTQGTAQVEIAGSGHPAFVRKSPPLARQIVFGLLLHGGFAPFMWTIEKLGLADSFFARAYKRQKEHREKANPFRDYRPGPQDVFVMTYPKSGTNWMMQIALQLIYHGAAEYEHIHSIVPWPDILAMPGILRDYAIPLEQATAWRDAPEHKRVIKTHFNWELLPDSDEARYIAVIRDPKDVFVSSYFFLRDGILGPAMPSVDTWYKLFLAATGPVGGSWAENAAGYWSQHARPNVLVLSFKHMKRDLRGTVERVARLLEIDVGAEVIDTVCHKASFDYMKGIDEKFAMGQTVPWMKPGAMLRKGKQGASSELLSLERQRAIDLHCQAELKRLGSDLPYEEFADVTA